MVEMRITPGECGGNGGMTGGGESGGEGGTRGGKGGFGGGGTSGGGGNVMSHVLHVWRHRQRNSLPKIGCRVPSGSHEACPRVCAAINLQVTTSP